MKIWKAIPAAAVLAAAVCAVCVIASADAGSEKTVDIIKDGEPVYSVTYSGFWTSDSAPKLEAVTALRDTLSDLSGAEVPLYYGEANYSDKEIVVGNTNMIIGEHKKRVAAGGTYAVEEELLGAGGFVITSTGDRYILAAANELGANNAGEYFLRVCLGVDLLDRDAPKKTTLSAPAEVSVIKTDYLDCPVLVTADIGGTDIGEYRVIYPEGASEDLIECAQTVRRYIFAMTGKAIELSDDSSEPSDREILIGETNRSSVSSLPDLSYTVKSDGEKIILAGKNAYLTRKAVDRFAAEQLKIADGAYTGGSVLHIGAADGVFESAFSYTLRDGLDASVYTMDNLKALLGSDGTPCFSDSETAGKLFDALDSEDLKTGGEVLVVCNRADWCGCEDCRGGTEAFFGTLNALADKFSAKGVTVAAVAQNETRKPPEEKLRDNVKIYFAEPYQCCAHGLGNAGCEKNREIAEDLAGWTKVCGNVAVVDFTMNSRSYPSTFPNFGIMLPNARFYHENGVSEVYMAWNSNGAALEFGKLRLALLDRVLDDPDMTEEEFESAFENIIERLYGDTASVIKSYIEKFTEAALGETDHFDIFTGADAILPIKTDPSGTGADRYDLALAKELANLWESIYKRHDMPVPPYYGLAMFAFNKAYLESDYYLPLHSRVQFTEWLNANIPVTDRNAVFSEIIASFPG